MKITVNFDLMDMLNETQTGISLKKTTKRVFGWSIVSFSIIQTLNVTLGQDVNTLNNMACAFLPQATMQLLMDLILSKPRKNLGCIRISRLLSELSKIDVYTEPKLLLNSYKYKTEYELIKSDSKIPLVQQKKYIMVPSYVNGEENEVSLLQEHIIGSNDYDLSLGEPKKVLKLAINPIKV